MAKVSGRRGEKVLIIGGGFAGAYLASSLERKLKQRKSKIGHVTLIDRNNYFVFYPLLTEAGTGSLHPRHAVVSIRSLLPKTRFIKGEVLGADFDRKVITCRCAGREELEEISYDHLVVSVGSVSYLPPIPGLQQHAFEMKSLADAVGLRDHAIEMLEKAANARSDEEKHRLLHFVVAGGSFTGVEVAGEFDVFLKKAAKNYPTIKPTDCQVTLIERSDRILPALDADLAAFALKSLRKRGIDVRFRTSIGELTANSVRLSDRTMLKSVTTIWCAGIAPNPLIARLGVPVNQQGYILCDRNLGVRGLSNVWAIGDCAVNIDHNSNPYPATAQHAVRQGKHLAENISLVAQGKTAQSCDLMNLGALVPLGCRTGVAEILGIRLSGPLAWFLWRTFYLLKMPGLGRKVRVAIDWTLDLLFKRDYVQLGWSNRSRANSLKPERLPDAA